VKECISYLIIEVMKVMGKMKENGGLGDMGHKVMEEEIERIICKGRSLKFLI